MLTTILTKESFLWIISQWKSRKVTDVSFTYLIFLNICSLSVTYFASIKQTLLWQNNEVP